MISKWQSVLALQLLVLLMSGCASIGQFHPDRITRFAPKDSTNVGYVDVYDLTLGKEKQVTSFWRELTFEIESDNVVTEWWQGKGARTWWSGRPENFGYVRVALPPGTHKFRFGKVDSGTSMSVPVFKEMVTLLWVRTDPEEVGYLSYHTNFKVVASFPTPDPSRPETMRGLVDLLQHKEWSVRWYAAQYLVEFGSDQVIGPLRALAERDPFLRAHVNKMIDLIREKLQSGAP